MLGLEVLGDRLDHDRAIGEIGHGAHHLDAGHDRLDHLGGDLPLLGGAREHLPDEIDRSRRRFGVGVIQLDAAAALHGDLRDAPAHQPRAGNSDQQILGVGIWQ